MGLGDELMLAGEARSVRAADPQQRRVKALRKPGGPFRWSEVWEHNPDMARPEEQGEFLILDENAGRRYRVSEAPDKRVWRTVGLRPVIHLTQSENDWAAAQSVTGMILIEPTLKANAPVNKRWDGWRDLVATAPDRPWLTIGRESLPGVRHVYTPTFRHAAAILARCRAAVLPEGGLHHAAAAVGTRAVVLFGGYISPEQTGYPEHINIFTGGEPCGMRIPCGHCRSAMEAITPARVLAALDLILTEGKAA